jgi:hypothetical protein
LIPDSSGLFDRDTLYLIIEGDKEMTSQTQTRGDETMKITCQNYDYVNTHGKDPKGRGAWVFRVDAHAPGRGYTSLGNMQANGTLSRARAEVKRMAKMEARQIGGVDELIIETQG